MNIRELRNSKKLSIQQFSREIGLEEKRLKIIERGLDTPSKSELQTLKRFFKISKFSKQMPNGSPIIGEGYVTAINTDFKVYEPSIARSENKPTVLDLFCGVGGISFGFEQTNNFSTVAGLDILEDRINTFQLNHAHAFGFSFDINKIPASDIQKYITYPPDVIVGGAPCQGFSSIRPFRTLSQNDSRNNLFQTFASYINFFKPTWFVFENVVGLLTHDSGNTLKSILSVLRSIGYSIDFRVLNSAYYGAPQLRERLIIIGNNKNIKFEWPAPTHYFDYKSMAGKGNPAVLKPTDRASTIQATTVMDALSDLPHLNSGESSSEYLKKAKLTDYQKYLREGSKILMNHDATAHSPEMMEIIRQSGFNIESVRHLVTSGFSTSYSRLEPNKPSVTLTVNFVSPSSNKCIHPLQDRALTPREGARIQGFPDKFLFFGSRTQIVKQIGNAVPPILSRVIADSIFKYY